MRAFWLAVVVAVALGIIGWYVLGAYQVPSEAAFSTESVRL